MKLQSLKKSLTNIYNKNKDNVFDIVLFGSFVKSKEAVGDIDIAVIFKEKLDKEVLSSIKEIDSIIHVDYLMLTELYSQPLWRTLIREGFSIVNNKKIMDSFGLKSYGIYTYDLTNLGNKKSRFSQILKGYKSESVIEKVNGVILKPGVILVPIEKIELFRTFLETWKVKYRLKYVYME